VADELARWAARRAPQLLARAEAEAMALMRDALLASALGERERQADVAALGAAAAEPEPAPEPGELLWAYCVLRAGDSPPQPSALAGVAASGPVERVEAGGLAALVSRVPRAQFGAEPLRRNLNDLGWLERVARTHERVLEQVLATATIVPLRLCTLYETEESVRRMLEREGDALGEALAALAGRQEWGVKVIVEPERLAAEARARSHSAPALEEELEARGGGGGAYMLRRRLERHVRELADALAREVAEQVHARLQDWALDAVSRPPQNRDLSGHEGEMLLNAAYLVEAERVGELRELVEELEARYRELGARIELSGPWPPYNFVPGGGAAAIA
jgi:Gas vesicle synthesis protein GvpL/GvpF